MADNFPKYDSQAIRSAFPEALQMHFDDELDDEGQVIGTMLTVADGKGPDVRIPLGTDLPPDTDALVQRMRDHYRGAFDLDALEETADAFAGFADDEP